MFPRSSRSFAAAALIVSLAVAICILTIATAPRLGQLPATAFFSLSLTLLILGASSRIEVPDAR